MRILMLSASLPYPPASGGAIRTYGIIKGLHDAGHDLTLLSFVDRDIDPNDTPLSNYCSHIETFPMPVRSKIDRLRNLLLSTQADIAGRFYDARFHDRLLELIQTESFDLVQFEAIEMGCYLPIVRQAAPHLKLCFDTFNAEAELQRVIFNIDRQDRRRLPAAIYSYLQIGRIRQFEGDLCRQADLVIAVSPEDAELLRQYKPEKPVHVVPSGISVDDYTKPDEVVTLPEPSVVFTGKMDYRPNVDAMLWFTESILPLVQQQQPDIHLTIVGQKPHPRLAHLKDAPNITITGWVDSVPPYLYACDVYVAPLRMGSGTRLKILEAMAAGCALVVTSTAAAGLLSEAKKAMIVTDRDHEMARHIVKLLQEPAQRRKLGDAARTAVRQYYDWSVLIPQLLEAYRTINLG